jgi:murein DD-endopeptidase MepM/ murein hydrolase activator NlpD
VPLAALLQTNGINNATAIRPGQRLVIPRYVTHSTSQASIPAAPARAVANENVHVVAPGDSLMSISRRHNVSLAALAHANNIQPSTRIAIGDRLTIPGGHQVVATRQNQYAAPAVAPPQIAQPRSVPAEQVATIPTQNARMATPEPAKAEDPVKTAEPAGAMQTFRWPVKGRVIAGFGPKPSGGQNDGINLAVPEGTPVKAADDGVVAYAGNELKGYGNLVLIRHANGFVSAYAHASELMVKRGDSIKRGQVIANAGQTGNVTSPQLHFEIRKGSTPVDPTKYLSGG